MDNSTLVAMNFGPLSWRPGIYLCLCSCVALCFMLKHLFLWILFRSLRQSLLKDALEYCSPGLASPLDIHEKRSRPCTASSLGIQEKSSPRDGDIEYDVFINYQKNEDSANRFVDNLYEVLKSCGVLAFVNGGEEEEALDGRTNYAISKATLCLAIFSKEYAQSPKCLSELYEMVKNGKKVIPLFFDVEPSDARWIKRSYAEAFQRHGRQQRFHIETLNNWKEALHAVSLVTGWELAQFKSLNFNISKFWSAVKKVSC